MKVRFLAASKKEFVEAVSFYSRAEIGLGDNFRNEVFETVQRVREFPTAWHEIGNGIRRCQVSRFPFGIIYRVLEKEITIVAVAHLHREPWYWSKRVK